MRIALLGDIHLYRLGVRPWQLLGKRLLGQINLWLNRRSRFDLSRLPGLLDRVETQEPDLLLCTGDLVTTASPQEFALAREKLLPTFLNHTTVITPGNHDRYTFTAARHRYLERSFLRHIPPDWPHHRPLGAHLRLIGLDAARPTLLTAGSRIPRAQLDRLADLLAGIRSDQRLIVMTHYSPGTPPGYRREPRHHGLKNAAALLDVLAGAGHPTLLLHGHVHQPWCWRPAAAPNVVMVNAGAPLMGDRRWPGGQGFWTIETDPEAEAEDWRLTHHAPDGSDGWRATAIAAPREPGVASPIVDGSQSAP